MIRSFMKQIVSHVLLREVFFLDSFVARFLLVLVCLIPFHSFAEHEQDVEMARRHSARPIFTSPQDVLVPGKAMVLMTHASTEWDRPRSAAKKGSLQLSRFAVERGLPLIYLQKDLDPEKNYCSHIKPKYFVSSQGGEFGFELSVTTVISGGGFFEKCHETTIRELLRLWGDDPKDCQLILVPSAIYTGFESDALELASPDSPLRSLFPKDSKEKLYTTVSLEEALFGFFKDEANRKNYLKKFVLEHYKPAEFVPNHRVVLYFGEDGTEIQSQEFPIAPTLKIYFPQMKNADEAGGIETYLKSKIPPLLKD